MKIILKRLPLMLLAIISLIFAMWSGLQRMGFQLPVVQSSFALAHGPLMVGGFLGTLISLERAVATGRDWAYGAPLLTGLSTFIFLAGGNFSLAAIILLAGSLWLLIIFINFLRRQKTLALYVMIAGIGCWVVGNLVWLGTGNIFRAVLWWAAFLIFTIAGERLELSRILRRTRIGILLFLLPVSLIISGIILFIWWVQTGIRVFGAGLLGLTAWLYYYDIARRTVRQPGLPRFIAICLLSGYFWLGISGIVAILFGWKSAGPHYDILLHSIFLGFVFSMIFGHAPIIFPAVLNLPVKFHTAFYLHLAVLHFSLLLRFWGDAAGWLPGRQWGAVANILAILLFLGNTAISVIRNRSAV